MKLKNDIKIKNQDVSLSTIYISDNPEDYGSRGQKWNSSFVQYMKSVVTHPIYQGMPDAVDEDGKIQWEAPSNRSSGKYQHTHHKRREWWKQKAIAIGINPNSDQWISRTAKNIHPTGEKPCKKCGTILRLAYVYPNNLLTRRIKAAFGEGFPISPLDPIEEVIQRAVDLFGNSVFVTFPQLLTTSKIEVPSFEDLDSFLIWIEDVYIPSESSLLSPGAMSNAPDRFDGFHSFNLCCRGTADSGRNATNLRSYSTDRRVFEFWSDGNWIAADRLMGLIRTKFANEPNADGGEGAPTADHIGPLSLGFCHTPSFRLLSRAANSAKNNRMSLQDVKMLIKAEENSADICSWYSKHLWDLRKNDVDNEEKALRLSKIMRDNQRNAMMILARLFQEKQYCFLIYLLELHYADYSVEFQNLTINGFNTHFDSILMTPRNSKYAIEQKARRLRIGFESLREYILKSNRHSFAITSSEIDQQVNEAIFYLQTQTQHIACNQEIEKALLPSSGMIVEQELRDLILKLPKGPISEFEVAKEMLKSAMEFIGDELSQLWDNDRYVREAFDLS